MLTPSQLIDLCHEYELRLVRAEEKTRLREDQLQHAKNLNAAYGMLGKEHGFTEQDARDRWRQAGYGGL